jgi:ribosomal protein L11 methyltransferase
VYEQALRSVCGTVGFFRDEPSGLWKIEGVKQAGEAEAQLAGALALASMVSGAEPTLHREDTPADGWLARTAAAFPEQRVGKRFVLRGTHLPPASSAGRIILQIDAGVAFGSGEHGSTRGCLLALERVAHRRPSRILDVGTGSGVLAMAAALLLHRPVLAIDIEPWSARTAADNAKRNGLGGRMAVAVGEGWRHHRVRAGRPYDLVFENILARPLCAMSRALSAGLAPMGLAILSGLLPNQSRMVLAAHRRSGMILHRSLTNDGWATLILKNRKGLQVGLNGSAQPVGPLRKQRLRQWRGERRADFLLSSRAARRILRRTHVPHRPA